MDPVHSGHDISVVFPCKNEEPTIGEAIDRARRAFSDRDLQVVVSDSSTDRTPEIARELGALVVTPPGLGYGAAYIHGFKHTTMVTSCLKIVTFMQRLTDLLQSKICGLEAKTGCSVLPLWVKTR